MNFDMVKPNANTTCITLHDVTAPEMNLRTTFYRYIALTRRPHVGRWKGLQAPLSTRWNRRHYNYSAKKAKVSSPIGL